MITLLETLLEGAEGSYASTRDLRNLEHVMSSWSERKEAYLAVQASEGSIIDRAMVMMQQGKPVQNNPVTIKYCRRDLTLALRYYALGMLMQDEEMLKERFLYWQKNVLQAMGFHNERGVKFVLESIYVELPQKQANLFQPYFKLGDDLIMSD